MDSQQVNTRFTATDEVSPVLKAIGSSVENLNSGLGMLNRAGSLVGMTLGITSVAALGTAAVQTMNKAVAVYTGLQQQEIKLQTIMHQRMAANQQMIDSIHGVMAAQTQLGVVGGGAQRAGAQQLATFLTQADSLKVLIPAMNNLAVQQAGVNVTSEHMVGLGNLMGKVMQGQTAALTRCGITFSDAEAQVLKYGNETERAAMLAQVITNNVGKMNEVFGQTPEGRRAQAVNRLAGAWANLGARISGVKAIMEAGFANMQADVLVKVTDGLALAFYTVGYAVYYGVDALVWFGETVLQVAENLGPFLGLMALWYATYEACITIGAAYTAVMKGMALAEAAHIAVSKVGAAIMAVKRGLVVADTVAMIGLRSGTFMATVAQTIFNGTLLACPAVWVATILTILIGVIIALAARMGTLKDVVKTVWHGIVDIITSAINIIIDGINVFIGAMNKAASLGNKLFHWDINPISKVQHVSSQGIKDAGDQFIDNPSEFIKGMIPKLPVPQGPGGIPAAGAENLGDIKDGVGKIADNTARIADKIDMTDKEIQELRDMAEKNTMVSWQEQHVTIQVSNENHLSNQVDVDGMTSSVIEGLRRALDVTQEGAVVY